VIWTDIHTFRFLVMRYNRFRTSITYCLHGRTFCGGPRKVTKRKEREGVPYISFIDFSPFLLSILLGLHLHVQSPMLDLGAGSDWHGMKP